MIGSPSATETKPQSTTLPQGKWIIYDGHCILCNGTIQWILKNDPKKQFKYTTLTGHWVEEHNVPVDAHGESVIYIEDGKIHYLSDATLTLSKHLKWPYSWLRVGLIIPKFIRNGIYKWIAKNRYKWFGHSETCLLPPAGWKDQFVD
ncbi:MAG: thiol-disulfide oxidoreductase DCC family protein [Schleiferiaceae bacterium]